MKIFISWSGKRSKALAVALKDWLPLVLQYATLWVSDKDISAGDRWAQTVAQELESSNFGILCVTPENIKSEWILFEAGALSKSMLDSKVIPLLFDLELSELSGPLSQFQALKVDQQGMLDVVKAINAIAENKAADTTIDQLVPALWGQLQQKLDDIPGKELTEKHLRPQTEILEELVSQVRGLGNRMRDFDLEAMEKDIQYANMHSWQIDSRMLDELMHMIMDTRNIDMSLLLLAGFFRERMPWLAEVLVEGHRELKTATSEEAREIGHRIVRVVQMTTRGPWSKLLMGRNKSSKVFIVELPHLIDTVIAQTIKDREIRELIGTAYEQEKSS